MLKNLKRLIVQKGENQMLNRYIWDIVLFLVQYIGIMNEAHKTHSSVAGIHYISGKPVRIDIRAGMITGITETDLPEEEKTNLFLGPGLIDNQINGYAGVDFSGNNLSSKEVVRASKAIWTDGVTTFLPTVITSSHDRLINNFRILREALETDEEVAGSIPGFHLEGPYISPDEGYRGCHPVQHVRKPSWNEFAEYQKAAGGNIIQVTLAPELEGAAGFIRQCRDEGIVTAMGHTRATSGEIEIAVENGVRLSTHLGNGCANFIHRHNNPIWPQLANEHLIPTIIADGFHLLPEELKVFLKVKGKNNLILTSDIVYLAGMVPGRYTFLESEVELTADGMLRNNALNCLAGASFPLKTGVGNMMKFTGCSLEDAFNMASGNVARIYGLEDRGSLSPGKRADIILFEKSGDTIIIRRTYVNGKLVFKN
jgi:N-acetylglucosamine-6-phosphate deacetylase